MKPKRKGNYSKAFKRQHPRIAGYADRMAKAMSSAEFALWIRMREKKSAMGYNVQKQRPISGWERFYIADFWVKKGNFVIEVDDPSHEDKRAADAMRAETMRKLHGITTIRIRNETLTDAPEDSALSLIAVMRHLHEGAVLPIAMVPVFVQDGPNLEKCDRSLREALSWAL
jgi:very-short-patch-repair endonuclease